MHCRPAYNDTKVELLKISTLKSVNGANNGLNNGDNKTELMKLSTFKVVVHYTFIKIVFYKTLRRSL